MDYLEYEVMSRFPLLSASEDLKKWTGFITTKVHTTLISLVAPHFPLATDVHLDFNDLDEKEKVYWNCHLDKIDKDECHTFLIYLERLSEEVYNLQPRNSDVSSEALTNSEMCTTVTDELENIGIQNVASLSQDLKQIVLKHIDESERQHFIKLNVPGGYPDVSIKIKTELPFAEDSISWPQRIPDIYQMFVSYVDKCCKFWDDMDYLDHTIKVLDPFQPTTSHYHRKVLSEDNVAVHLVFNPLAPRAFPTISFAGPEKLIEAYSAAIDQECNIWDENNTPLHNLKLILNCEFLMKETGYGDGENEEGNEQTPCPICFVYDFEGEIPEIVCVCDTAFHRQCLIDLFVSDVSKTSLRRRLVECLNCQMEITVPHGTARAGSDW